MGLFGDRWEIPWEVKNYLVNHQPRIRGYTLHDLMRETTFRRVKWPSSLGMSGITMHPDNVLLDDRVTDSDDHHFVACVCAHELVHVAQQLDWGHILFMLQYGVEALGCFFSYGCMKRRKIEREAYEFEEEFGISIGHYRPKMERTACTNRAAVSESVDFVLKQKYAKRGRVKPTGKTAWAKRRKGKTR